jgi:PAS domain S-box-containing protein
MGGGGGSLPSQPRWQPPLNPNGSRRHVASAPPPPPPRSGHTRDLGTILSVNAYACRLFGYTRVQLERRAIDVLIPEPIASLHAGFMQRYLATGEGRFVASTSVSLGKTKSGHIFPTLFSVRESVADSGEPHFTGLLRPISTPDNYVLLTADWVVTGVDVASHTLLGVSPSALEEEALPISRFIPDFADHEELLTHDNGCHLVVRALATLASRSSAADGEGGAGEDAETSRTVNAGDGVTIRAHLQTVVLQGGVTLHLLAWHLPRVRAAASVPAPADLRRASTGASLVNMPSLLRMGGSGGVAAGMSRSSLTGVPGGVGPASGAAWAARAGSACPVMHTASQQPPLGHPPVKAAPPTVSEGDGDTEAVAVSFNTAISKPVPFPVSSLRGTRGIGPFGVSERRLSFVEPAPEADTDRRADSGAGAMPLPTPAPAPAPAPASPIPTAAGDHPSVVPVDGDSGERGGAPSATASASLRSSSGDGMIAVTTHLSSRHTSEPVPVVPSFPDGGGGRARVSVAAPPPVYRGPRFSPPVPAADVGALAAPAPPPTVIPARATPAATPAPSVDGGDAGGDRRSLASSSKRNAGRRTMARLRRALLDVEGSHLSISGMVRLWWLGVVVMVVTIVLGVAAALILIASVDEYSTAVQVSTLAARNVQLLYSMLQGVKRLMFSAAGWLVLPPAALLLSSAETKADALHFARNHREVYGLVADTPMAAAYTASDLTSNIFDGRIVPHGVLTEATAQAFIAANGIGLSPIPGGELLVSERIRTTYLNYGLQFASEMVRLAQAPPANVTMSNFLRAC